MDAPLDSAILVTDHRGAVWLTPDGEVETLTPAEAIRRVDRMRPIVCHGPATAARLGTARFAAADVLELFAFVRPARFCLPTASGLATAMRLPAPKTLEDQALVLAQAVALLLDEAATLDRRAGQLAHFLVRAGWAWGAALAARLPIERHDRLGGLDVWNALEEWQEPAPQAPPGNDPVRPEEARERLRDLLGPGAETRTAQSDYAASVARAFQPRDMVDAPNMVLAEAGTGTGKTLGYVAPASLWAEKNGGAVWLSTYTRNLQRQIDRELARLHPDPAEKARRVVVRKGRENYLCLLNVEEAAQGGAVRPADAVPLALVARWAQASRAGDIVGGDFPGWLVELFGPARTLSLTDHRGECVFAACAHYRKCFVERNIRAARRADMVIANHALVLATAVQANDPREAPTRLVFDEGHHLFEAADSAFAAHLSGWETAELRRWLRGPEGGRRQRGRGLEKRVADLLRDDDETALLGEVLRAAIALPGEGWLPRLRDASPSGPTEIFLARVRQQVMARGRDPDGAYAIECPTNDPVPGLLPASRDLHAALAGIRQPLIKLSDALVKRLDDEAAELDTGLRARIDAAARGLVRRAQTIGAWQAMLDSLGAPANDMTVDWFALEKSDGRESDVAYCRHFVDPMVPFAAAVLQPAHGVLVTSATLRDRGGEDWTTAELRTGARHLALPAVRTALPSPFDFAHNTRIFAVTDVRRDDVAQVTAAYRELFLASGGGALGLFTAINRLRAVHRRLAPALAEAGLSLLAQHVDPLDVATLVEIFRAEEDTSLLGTDAVRDGVDVPGRSLRLIVFDRVPWPRPDLLHKARRERFGKQSWDDMLTRLKLKQAFGRLLRRADDRGVFVMLDAQFPSRLHDAFPAEVEVHRCGLAEAVAGVRDFLSPPALAGATARG